MGEQLRNEGVLTCWLASYIKGGTFCTVRYSANNCWNVNLTTGNVNNNNTYNRYFVVGASESFPDCDKWSAAEKSFFAIGLYLLH